MAILHTPAFGNGVCVGGWGRNSIDFFFSPFENSQNFQENEWWLLSSYHAKWHLCSSVPPGLKHVLTNPGNPPLNVVLNWMEELCIVQQVIDLFCRASNPGCALKPPGRWGRLFEIIVYTGPQFITMQSLG